MSHIFLAEDIDEIILMQNAGLLQRFQIAGA